VLDYFGELGGEGLFGASGGVEDGHVHVGFGEFGVGGVDELVVLGGGSLDVSFWEGLIG